MLVYADFIIYTQSDHPSALGITTRGDPQSLYIVPSRSISTRSVKEYKICNSLLQVGLTASRNCNETLNCRVQLTFFRVPQKILVQFHR